jgi:N6-adenosine-specific RNA methylase IME4
MGAHPETVERLLGEGRVARNVILGEIRRPAPAAHEPGCTVADLHALVASGRRFGCIYADPPWRYGNGGTDNAASKQYPTMSCEDIAALPVGDLAASPAHLHLWATNNFLGEALGLLVHWGFEHKSCFVWCKQGLGMGNYWRVTHEFLLLGVRGSCTFHDHALRSWGEYARGEHSAKPEQVRLAIERASPGPYLELFARWGVPGWTVWGDPISHDLFTRSLPHE